jgi:uncharacterized integral membrane protein (TIGR00698 family)
MSALLGTLVDKSPMRNGSRKTALALLVVGAAGVLSVVLAHYPLLSEAGLSALTLAICLGIALGNVARVPLDSATQRGIDFARQRMLRIGIVLYGTKLTFGQLQALGTEGIAISLLVLTSTLCLGLWLGRMLGLSRCQALLISVGSAVCGAAAVIAATPVARGAPKDTAVAVSTVVLFGTLGMFAYPMIYHVLTHSLALVVGPRAFGIYTGSTLHEVAQVVAAAKPLGDEAMDFAVVSKMVRVLALAPVLVLLAMLPQRDESKIHHVVDVPACSYRASLAAGLQAAWKAMPWFAFGLVAVAGINSIGAIPVAWHPTLSLFDTWLLACAMFAIGTQTRLSMFKQAGAAPLKLAAALFLFLMVGGGAINVALHSF